MSGALLSALILAANSASAESTSFVSKFLKDETVTAHSGAITIQDTLNVNKL